MPPKLTYESAQQTSDFPGPAEPEMEPVEDFLADRGLESLANHTVTGHDGEPMTLAAALASCGPARNSIDATLDTIRDVAGEDVDLVPLMEKHLNRMEEKAQNTNILDSKKNNLEPVLEQVVQIKSKIKSPAHEHTKKNSEKVKEATPKIKTIRQPTAAELAQVQFEKDEIIRHGATQVHQPITKKKPELPELKTKEPDSVSSYQYKEKNSLEVKPKITLIESINQKAEPSSKQQEQNTLRLQSAPEPFGKNSKPTSQSFIKSEKKEDELIRKNLPIQNNGVHNSVHIAPVPDSKREIQVVETLTQKTTPEKTLSYELPTHQLTDQHNEPILLEVESLQLPNEAELITVQENNDDWIDTLVPKHKAEAIAEIIEIPEEQEEQTINWLEILPEPVQSSLAEYLQAEELEPEEKEAAKELIINIAEAADHLNELAEADELDGEEAVVIQQKITEWYTELLEPLDLDIKVYETEIACLIEQICSKSYGSKEPKTENFLDELREQLSLHRSTLDLKVAAKSVAQTAQTAQIRVARLMVQRSAALFPAIIK